MFRGLTEAEWVKVMRARSEAPGLVVAAVRRADRVAARIVAKGTIPPSPPRGRQTGTAGAIAECWAAELSAVMVKDGSLFDPVAEGGLGVRPDLFRISGYLTDGGGVPAAEYQAQVAAKEAADAKEGAAAIAAQKAEVKALEAEVGSLSSSLAAAQLQDGQGQCLLGTARERVPFAARIQAAGQAVDAEAEEGVAQAPARRQRLGSS